MNINRLFVVMLYPTSGHTAKTIAFSLKLFCALRMQSIQGILHTIEESVQQFFIGVEAGVENGEVT
jgi:hypothetical protein